MKIDKNKINKEDWIELEDSDGVSFKIKSFPTSKFVFRSVEDNEFETHWNIFNYSLLDWKGITDQEDKPLECNEENKRLIFEHSYESAIFVCNKALEEGYNVIEKKT